MIFEQFDKCKLSKHCVLNLITQVNQIVSTYCSQSNSQVNFNSSIHSLISNKKRIKEKRL